MSEERAAYDPQRERVGARQAQPRAGGLPPWCPQCACCSLGADGNCLGGCVRTARHLPLHPEVAAELQAALAAVAMEEGEVLECLRELETSRQTLLAAEDAVYLAHLDPKTLGANERLREATVRDLTADEARDVRVDEANLRRAQSRLRCAMAQLSTYRAVAGLLRGSEGHPG